MKLLSSSSSNQNKNLNIYHTYVRHKEIFIKLHFQLLDFAYKLFYVVLLRNCAIPQANSDEVTLKVYSLILDQ